MYRQASDARLLRSHSLVLLIALILTILLTNTSIAAEPKWIEIRNDNFHVYSTVSERKTRDVLNQFERVRGFFIQLVGAKLENSNPVSVVIFGSKKQYQPFTFNEVAAAYYLNHFGRDFIVIGDVSAESSQIASHEYTHLVFQNAGFRLPPWLNEGLAELYSTLSPAGAETEIGDVLPGHLYELNNKPWVSLETILTADKSSPYYNETQKAGSLYSQSWALVHMLNTTAKYRGKFWNLVEAINSGMPSVLALETIYRMPFAELERDLLTYIQKTSFSKLMVKIKLDETKKLTSKPADMFEVRELQAELLMGLPNKQAEARQRLDQLTLEKPKRSEPWANLGYLAWQEGNQSKAVENFTKAVELGNRSPQLLLNLAQLSLYDKPDAAINTLKSLLEIEPNNIDARLLLANLQMQKNLFSEAAITTRSITKVDTIEQRDGLLYIRAFAAMQLGFKAEARELAEELKTVTLSEHFRTQATEIIRILDRR